MNTFQLRVIARVVLLAATLLLFSFLAANKGLLFVTVMVVLLSAYQIYSLICFVEKTNRDLSRFLNSINCDDTSPAFTGNKLGPSFTELSEAFNKVVLKIQDARSEMEVHARYLNTVIQHVGTGLLAYKPEGTVTLINSAAKKLLRIPGLNDIADLRPIHPELADTLLKVKNNDRMLIKFHNEGETGFLSVFAHMFVLREEPYVLISLQNIQAELEEKEMEAWQNLIRVLTHEIMNSITPISSMTATLLDMIGSDTAEHLNREDARDMEAALRTIHQRSQGLMNFVNSYRNMTLIPKPKFRLLSISEFFRRVEQLMNHRLSNDGITFKWSVEPETLEFTADPDLMEQVMINLLLNAIYAVAGRANPRIALSASLSPGGMVTMSVEDNGVGIVEEALEKIFIPFFTTKRQGSGIGLSLSRQILRLHNATISAKSIPDQGSTFTLRFG